MYTNKEIYLALKLIHDICKQNGACYKCPFYYEEVEACMVSNGKDPENWKLVPPPESVEGCPFE